MRRFSPAAWAGEIVLCFAARSRLRLVASRLMARWRTAESSVWRFMDEILRCAPFLRQGRQDDGNGNDRGNYKSNDNRNGAAGQRLPPFQRLAGRGTRNCKCKSDSEFQGV